jgi:4-hydroxybenzoyl-CoA reductase alpha subunit
MPSDREFNLIGKSPRRVDGMSKCTGTTKFADDLFMPRMLFAKLYRSPVAYAKIVRIDTSKAEAMPGVVAVLTGESMPVTFGILPVSQDEHALAIDKVRYIGDPVAAVAAVTEATAYEAMMAIEVTYEDLPIVYNAEQALTNEAPPIHDYGDDGNVHKRVSMQFGDVEKAFENADEIFEGTYNFGSNTHLPMEQHASLGYTDPDGKVTIWSSTQTPHYLHKATSKVLGLPPSRVRIIACPNGGGFGGKSDPFNHEIVVAKLSQLTNRPVKISLTREEVFQCHRGRHAVLMHSKLGMTKDGKITGLHFQSLLDGGSHGSYGVATTYYTGALQTVTYEVPAYRFDGVRAFTNKAPSGPKRGHGTPQPRFAIEVQLDKAAEKLGINPADLRLGMIQPPDSVTANWLYINSTGLAECIEKVVKGSNYRERHGKLPRGHGLGLACSSYISGAGLPIYWNAMPHSGVQLKVDRGGGVAVFCGETEIGQGSDTVLATCVAEVLGLELLDVRVCVADTDLTPVDLGSYSSRVTLMMGNAAIQAAERAREIISKHAAKKLEIPGTRVVFAENRVFDAEDPERGMTFSEAVMIAEAANGTIGTVGSYSPPPNPGRYRGSGVGPTATYSYSAAVVEIFADEETGLIKVKRVHIAHDIGRALNRNLAIGQVEGGVYMGLGEALMEDMEYREKRFGVLKHPSVLEYKTLTTHEMPEVITYLVENPDSRGPFGAKEVGQGPLLPMMPAVANALHDALGVRVDQVPIHPDLVMKALKAKDHRAGPTKFPDLKITDTQRVRTEAEGGDGTAPRPAKKVEANQS